MLIESFEQTKMYLKTDDDFNFFIGFEEDNCINWKPMEQHIYFNTKADGGNWYKVEGF